MSSRLGHIKTSSTLSLLPPDQLNILSNRNQTTSATSLFGLSDYDTQRETRVELAIRDLLTKTNNEDNNLDLSISLLDKSISQIDSELKSIRAKNRNPKKQNGIRLLSITEGEVIKLSLLKGAARYYKIRSKYRFSPLILRNSSKQKRILRWAHL